MAPLIRRVLVWAAAASLALAGEARAQNLQMLRDAEIESILLTYETPVARAAGLDPSSLHIYLINDQQLNSFVAGGQNIFMNTGTINRSSTPNQLVGIMAHETGHIAGGHIARSEDAMRKAGYAGIAAAVLGIALAALSGGMGAPAILAAEGVAERTWLKFSVEQEARADQAALTFLDRTHQSAKGLLQFFEILQQELFLSGQHEDPYLRTHPLTAQRVDYVREHVAKSPYSNNPDPPDWIELYKRMKAKLAGFLDAPQQTLDTYKADDKSVSARYARAIAYYRIPDLAHAVPAVDALIRDYPNDPYFQELKGQMLFENGRIAEAVGPYTQSVKLDPSSTLLKIELAQVQLETDDAKLLPIAQRNLEEVTRIEVQNAEAWRLLAIAYGKNNNMGQMALALAEQGASSGNYKDARQQAQRAMQILPRGPARQRAQDIADEAKRQIDAGNGGGRPDQ